MALPTYTEYLAQQAKKNKQKTGHVSVPIKGKSKVMVENNTGGFVFKISMWQQLERFLILGTEGGTYYVGEQKYTKDNATNVLKCIKEDGVKTVNTIFEISNEGRAAKQSPGLFALALAFAFGDNKTKQQVEDVFNGVCRYSTTLFEFVTYYLALEKGWNRRLRRMIGNWYKSKDVNALSYQVTKYRQRDGWTHADILRLCHVTDDSKDKSKQAIYRWVIAGIEGLKKREVIRKVPNASKKGTVEVKKVYPDLTGYTPDYIEGFEKAKEAKSAKEIVKLIDKYSLTREMLPTEALTYPEVWEYLLLKMPIEAMIRNLGVMTARGVLAPLSVSTKLVNSRLADADYLHKARIHPIKVLSAFRVYNQGAGDKGSLTWKPVQTIVDHLDAAFYASFKNVEPTGKHMYFGIDCSGSMGSPAIGGTGLTPRDVAAAFCLVLANTEKSYVIKGFNNTLGDLNISSSMRLDKVIKVMEQFNWGSTNISLPIQDAINNGYGVDAFVTITDNEVNTGSHPKVILDKYRKEYVPNARCIVLGTTATKFSVNDPADPFGLDIAGFDSAIPQIVSDFVKD